MAEGLRWGILSTAKIGRKSVIPAIKRSRNGSVVAIASRDKGLARQVADELEIPRAFGSYEELLASPDVDAVYIPLPNHMHKEWTIHSAESGKHILCEKPFAMNASEVEEMIAAAREHRVVLAEAFMYRFHPQFVRLKELIADGAIGDLEVIRSAFCFRLQNPDTNIRAKPEMGGGALMDIGCYCVNMSRFLAREPIEVQASAAIGPKTGVDEQTVGILRFANDVFATFDCSFRSDYREWLEVQGNKHRIHLPRPIKPGTRSAEINISYDESGEIEPRATIITAPAANHYRLMVENFADAVLNDASLAFPPEDGLANMRVLDALYESARSGRAVQVKSA